MIWHSRNLSYYFYVEDIYADFYVNILVETVIFLRIIW